MLKSASMPAAAARVSAAPYHLLMAATIVGAAALYLLGNGRVALWDRDEPRYAQCSRQMLDGFAGPRGAHPPGFVVPHFLDDLRTEKPPLIYWCQVAAMRMLGENDFAARLPSAVAMTAVLGLLAVVLYRAVGPARATWAVFILATSALAIMSAKMCLTDAVLLLWLVMAQICTFAVYRGNRSWMVTLLLWGALGVGGLAKGPIVLAVIGMTLLALAIFDYFGERRLNIGWWWSGLRPWAGLIIIAAIAGPWPLAVHHAEPRFLPRLIAAGRRHLAASHEKHVSPPGYYLMMIWGLWFPWSLLLPTTLVISWRNRREPLIRFCLATLLGVWVFQELMTTKLPFYMLPTFPALAVLTADALLRCVRGEHDDLLRPAFTAAVIVWVLAVLALGSAGWLLLMPKLGIGDLVPKGVTAILTAAAVAYAAVVLRLFKSRRLAGGAVAMGIGAALIFAILFNAYLPRAEYLRTSPRIAAVLRQQSIAPGNAIMIEYKEPSLAWYEGGTIVEEGAMHFLDKNPPESWPTWIVLPKTVWDRLRSDTRAMLEIVAGPLRGVNYAGKIDGRQIVDVMVVRKKQRPRGTSD